MEIRVRKLLFVWLALYASYNSFSQAVIPYGDNKEVGKYIMLNGVKHYYEVYGNGKPLLLIHGNSTATKGWAAQIDYFAKKNRVYSIDCRGRGKSDLGTDSLTYMQQARDMKAFIEQLHLDSVNVLGRSDGGIIAILMAIYFPQHLHKIVAFGANMEPDTSALYLPTVEDAHNERVHADSMLMKKDKSKNWLVEQQRNRMMEFQPHITAAELNRITLPVLVMSCDRDVIREEHTLFIYKNIQGANLCIFPNERHRVSRLNPELFNTTVDHYLSGPVTGMDYRFEK